MTSLLPTSIISELTADELNGVNVANIRHSYNYLLLRFGQFSDKPLFRTTFGQRSGNFSDIGRTRTDFFLRLIPLVGMKLEGYLVIKFGLKKGIEYSLRANMIAV